MTLTSRHSRTTPAAVASAEDIRTRVRAAVAAAHDTKAENVRVRHLEPVTSFADYFVIASAGNERQVKAIANAVEESLLEIGVRPLHVEGYTGAQWVLLDYGDVTPDFAPADLPGSAGAARGPETPEPGS